MEAESLSGRRAGSCETHTRNCGFIGFMVPATGHRKGNSFLRCPNPYAAAAALCRSGSQCRSSTCGAERSKAFWPRPPWHAADRAFGNRHRPAFGTEEALHAREHEMRRFVEGAAHHGVAGLGDGYSRIGPLNCERIAGSHQRMFRTAPNTRSWTICAALSKATMRAKPRASNSKALFWAGQRPMPFADGLAAYPGYQM